MFGLTLLFSKASQTGSAGAAGITSLVLTSLLGGFFFAVVTMTLAPKKDGSKTPVLLKILISVGAFELWFLAYLGFSYLPAVINPLLPGYCRIRRNRLYRFRFWRKKTVSKVDSSVVAHVVHKPSKQLELVRMNR